MAGVNTHFIAQLELENDIRINSLNFLGLGNVEIEKRRERQKS